jgi:drug/metabolite transporter (DMT)-like permease
VLFIGVFLVGLSSLIHPDDGGGSETSAAGLILLLCAQLFAGTQFIVEEKLLGNYYLDPLKVVGLEGMWGLCYWAVLLPPMQFINVDGEPIEDSKFALQ